MDRRLQDWFHIAADKDCLTPAQRLEGREWRTASEKLKRKTLGLTDTSLLVCCWWYDSCHNIVCCATAEIIFSKT